MVNTDSRRGGPGQNHVLGEQNGRKTTDRAEQTMTNTGAPHAAGRMSLASRPGRPSGALSKHYTESSRDPADSPLDKHLGN